MSDATVAAGNLRTRAAGTDSPKKVAPAQGWTPAFNPWLIAASVMLATFMEVLDTSVANVSLPYIAGNLSATTEESTWVLTSYLISNAIILPATGWLGRYFGRKRFLVVCIAIFTIASAACGAATSLGFLLFARVLQGAGGGALQPIAQAVLLESFPPEKRGSAIALYGLGIVVAPIIGPTLGGWVTDNYSWRWIFYINVPIGILAMFMTNAFVEDPPYIKTQKPGQIDYIGFGLMALGLSSLQIVLDKGQELDWFGSVFITWAAVLAGVALVGFVVWELTTPEPIVNLRVLANRNFAVGTVLIALFGSVLYGTIALLPLFLQTLIGYPALQSGLAVSPRGIGAVASMLIVGRLINKVDGRYLIMFGFALIGVSTYMLSDIDIQISMGSIVGPQVVAGLAIGFVFVPMTIMATGTVANEQLGNATGIFNLMRNLGGSFGIAGVTTLLARGAQLHQSEMVYHLTPYDPVFQERLAQLASVLSANGNPASAPGQAYGALYQTLLGQATMLAYIDIFRLLAFLCIICIPVALVFRKVRSTRVAPSLH
ncbi:MAG TPA: DHA2 family efflux MFS transporter permease subunit [Pyrinomonadaceae bacterium]|nr:DHA2 family efflux MFS transporter permease subunit [Pyrinomonadaceae bacterium]